MVEDIIMVGIIEADTITTKGEDIDLDTTTIMDTDIAMVDAIELHQEVMDIIKIEMTTKIVADTVTIETTIRILEIINTIKITVILLEIEIIRIIEVITTAIEMLITIEIAILTTIELLDRIHKQEDIDRFLGGLECIQDLLAYVAIISKTFPTIKPANVPTI